MKRKIETPWCKRWWAIVLYIFFGLIFLSVLTTSPHDTSSSRNVLAASPSVVPEYGKNSVKTL